MEKNRLEKFIRDIPNFPKKGIIFKDITTLLNNPKAFRSAVDAMAQEFKNKKIDYVVSVEARGFIFGAPLAYKLNAGFVPVRKKGKLPARTKAVTYDLEYGTDTVEIHSDEIRKGARVLIVDDLLATGGTVGAVAKLLKGFGAKVVSVAFLIELNFLNGRKKLKGLPVSSIISY